MCLFYYKALVEIFSRNFHGNYEIKYFITFYVTGLTYVTRAVELRVVLIRK